MERNEFDVSIFIINEDGDYINAYEYDYPEDGECVFIMLTSDVLNQECKTDNSICISPKYMNGIKRTDVKDLKNYYSVYFKDNMLEPLIIMPWCTINLFITFFEGNKEFDDAKMDFNGFEHTLRIVSEAQGFLDYYNKYNQHKFDRVEQLFPAFYLTYNTMISFNNRPVRGFLPSFGQLLLIQYHSGRISSLLKRNLSYINRQLNIDDKSYWSSTDRDYDIAWVLHYGGTQLSSKVWGYQILPLFSLK